MNPECPKSDEGHSWRKYGSYSRKWGVKKKVPRWQCSQCGATTINRPGDKDNSAPRPGPRRGHTIDHPEGYDAFWPAMEREAARVGLYEAMEVVARELGVHRLTVRRWVSQRRVSGNNTGVVEGAIAIVDGHGYEMPTIRGMDGWRGIWGWQTPPFLYTDPRAEPQFFALRKRGDRLWRQLLKAGSIASVVVGDAGPLTFWQESDLSDRSVDELRAGGLLGREHQDRSFTYWIAFDTVSATPSDWGTRYETSTTALVCSRTRVVGTVKESWWSDLQYPSMTARLDLNNTARSYNGVKIPVPAATIRRSGQPALEFPMELRCRSVKS